MNRVFICGLLGRDPEVKGTVVKLSVATTKKYTDKSGQKQEKTAWHRVVFFGKTGEIVAKYFTKGKPILIEGEIDYQKYTDKNGVEKYSTEIIADKFSFVPGTGKGSSAGSGFGGDDALDRGVAMAGDTFGAAPVDDSEIPF